MSALVLRRLVAAVALAGAVLVGVLVLGHDTGTIVHAKFRSAGLLIKGNRVLVAGRQVGRISRITVDDDGLADVALRITDDDVLPLRRGARATIRALGQAGIANRYVELSPGATDGPPLRGDVLGLAQTQGIVDLDELFNSFTPQRRANVRELIKHASEIYAGSGARSFNGTLAKLSPALGELSNVADDLAADDVALVDLVQRGAVASTAVASRRPDLEAAIRNTGVAFGAVAQERRALSDAIARAPGVLTQATGTLKRAGTTLTALRPALRAVPPAARPLRPALAEVHAGFPAIDGALRDLNGQIPPLNRALIQFRTLAPSTVAALKSTGRALTVLRPTFEALRLYGTDLVIGALSGFGGVASGPYNDYGHYVKANFIQSAQSLLLGDGSSLLTSQPLVPGVLAVQTGLNRRCPGGNAPPAPDGSNPWVQPESICSADDDLSAAVNEP